MKGDREGWVVLKLRPDERQMKPENAMNVKTKQRNNVKDVSKNVRWLGSLGVKAKMLCDDDRSVGEMTGNVSKIKIKLNKLS